MKIVLPHHKKAQPVESWGQIKAEAKEMLDFLNAGNFPGKWKEGLALSHAQVSESPLDFFVVHRDMVKEFSGFEVFCNVAIISADSPIPFKEACMSFPFRDLIKTRRAAVVEIEADVLNPLKIFGSGFSRRRFRLEALAAFIVQHETDHAKGINIYERFKK